MKKHCQNPVVTRTRSYLQNEGPQALAIITTTQDTKASKLHNCSVAATIYLGTKNHFKLHFLSVWEFCLYPAVRVLGGLPTGRKGSGIWNQAWVGNNQGCTVSLSTTVTCAYLPFTHQITTISMSRWRNHILGGRVFSFALDTIHCNER